MPLILLSKPSYFVLFVFLYNYGSALWRLSSSGLRTLKVTFNNLLRRIRSFLGIVTLASFTVLVVFKASLMLFIAQVCCVRKLETGTPLIHIFTEAPQFSYTTFVFNASNYKRYWRTYTEMCSNFCKRCQVISTREQRTY